MEDVAREKRAKLEAGTLTLDDVRELAHTLVEHLFDALDAHDDGCVVGCKFVGQIVEHCERAGAVVEHGLTRH